MAAVSTDVVPRFCVLGGGLSGLASAFFLQRHFPLSQISVVRGHREGTGAAAGSLIATLKGSHGQVFEQGFHSSILNNRNGREALGLARLLKLEEEVISADVRASSRRHLLHFGRVQLFPRSLHVVRYCPALLAEPLWPRGSASDETVHAFVARRTSTAVADRIADPLCRGQLAGDARSLSLRTCFPRVWFNERRFKSIFVGALFSTAVAYRQRSWLSLDVFDPLLQRVSAGGRCYSFRAGLGTLLDRLEEALRKPLPGTRPAELLDGSVVTGFQESEHSSGRSAQVTLCDGRTLAADTVIAALPPGELACILRKSCLDASSNDASLCELLAGIAHESVAIVGIGFATDVLRPHFCGAGYFVGSHELQGGAVLGMSWDSQLFPAQDPQPGRTRLSVYIAGPECTLGNEAALEEMAMEAVRKHLGVHDEPSEVRAAVWPQATPQYAVGHHNVLRAVEAMRIARLPWLQVAGAGYFGTRSAADEIVDARKLADGLRRRFARFPGLVENEGPEDTDPRYGAGFNVD